MNDCQGVDPKSCFGYHGAMILRSVITWEDPNVVSVEEAHNTFEKIPPSQTQEETQRPLLPVCTDMVGQQFDITDSHDCKYIRNYKRSVRTNHNGVTGVPVLSIPLISSKWIKLSNIP
jgi:hypothetical protein